MSRTANAIRKFFLVNGALVRHLRTRRGAVPKVKRHAEEKHHDLLGMLPDETLASKTRPIINHTKVITKSEIASDQYEVKELKRHRDDEDVKPKIQLGRNIADDIRSNKNFYKRAQKIDPLTANTPDLWKMDRVKLAKVIRKQVIYADKNLTIVNKPYGIAVHGGDAMQNSLDSCSTILSKMIFGLNTSVPLLLCNRLDKFTTGIVVYATNKDLAQEIKRLFREQRARRKYWGVTLGVPDPREGIVDIPLRMKHIQRDDHFSTHFRMMIAPEDKLDYETGQMMKAPSRRADFATTHFRVLDTNDSLSLVEFQPFTTVKHQIRVHASEGLSCCVLGDHKYQRNDKLLPQRLPKSILAKFDMKPTKSRDMPMHLHFREILLPGILENASKPNLLVSAKPSTHMYKTMQLFKLKPGVETDFKYPTAFQLSTQKTVRNHPSMEELYEDPFANKQTESERTNMQRGDCYAVYKPRVFVKFQDGG